MLSNTEEQDLRSTTRVNVVIVLIRIMCSQIVKRNKRNIVIFNATVLYKEERFHTIYLIYGIQWVLQC